MASRGHELNIKLTAKDDASATVDDVARKLDKLSDEDREFVLRARVSQAEREIGRLTKQLANIDKLDDDEIELIVRARDEATAKLNGLRSELDKVDAAAADAESALKDAERAAERLGDADVTPAVDSTNKLRAEVDGVRSSTDRASSASKSFAGNVVGDSFAAATGIGTLGESVSQVTEGLLEGEIAMGGLAKAGLSMGAVAVLMWGISEQLKAIAERDAFNKQRVEDYADALAEADTRIQAITEKLTEAETFAFDARSLFGTDVLIKKFNELGMSVDDVTRLVAEGREGVDRWAQGLADAGMPAAHVTILVEALYNEVDALAETEGDAAEAAKFFGKAHEIAAREIEKAKEAIDAAREAAKAEAEAIIEGAEALREQVSARRAAVDATYALREESAGFAEALIEADKAIVEADGNLVAIRLTMDDVALAAAEVADAEARVAEEVAAAAGQTLTAKQRLDVWNQSMLGAAATAKGPLRQGILEYIAEVNGIPKATVTEITAALDRGDLAEANRLLAETSRSRQTLIQAQLDDWQARRDLAALTAERYVPIVPRVTGRTPQRFARGTKGAPGGTALVGEDGPELVELPRGAGVRNAQETAAMASASSAPVTVVNNWPAGVTPSDVARAQRRYARIQGPLT
jgi:hypothetical protein